ncbi:MAG: GNAT family N-acetyltransferase [Bryobacteraceae bacterium]
MLQRRARKMNVPENFEIRELRAIGDLAEAVRLQQRIWEFDDIDLVPLRMFVVVTRIGGQALGAFEKGRMIAFCLCLPGLKPGRQSYLHSHMLGVLPEYRNSGAGRRLKFKQREDALTQGIPLIEWTFDPLEIKNAFFNIERLGAVARRFVHNQYGATSSRLHGGLPTDRLIAEWWIGSARVAAVQSGEPPNSFPIEARISVPARIAEFREHEPARAREIQSSVAEQFERHFRDGLAVIGFERTPEAGVYLLAPWDSK